jgi:hypothetical protein
LQGWQYVPPPPGSGYCCGQCEQVACVVDDKLYKPGTEWSSDDGCLTHSCSNNFTVSIYMYVSECPIIASLLRNSRNFTSVLYADAWMVIFVLLIPD